MNPRSVSASSLEVAGKCLRRYYSENILYGAQIQGTAAGTGLVCHGALEDLLRGVFFHKTIPFTEEQLLLLSEKHFGEIFGTDRNRPEYEDARTLLRNWINRDGQYERLAEVQILSLEAKVSFPVPFENEDGKKQEVPFNYLMDRLERVDEDTIRVVDYKSNRVALTEAQLRKKKQARYYALAVQIKFPKTKKIIVEFDFLRHFPVSTVFTREDNIETWNELKRSVQTIINADGESAPETLNVDCGWCIRKSECKTLTSNTDAGGIVNKDINSLAESYERLVNQTKALGILKDEIEARLLGHAIETDVLEFETPTATVEVAGKTRRKVNKAVVLAILGSRASEFSNFTVTQVTDLLKRNNPTLTQQEKILMRTAIDVEIAEPTIKVMLKDQYHQ